MRSSVLAPVLLGTVAVISHPDPGSASLSTRSRAIHAPVLAEAAEPFGKVSIDEDGVSKRQEHVDTLGRLLPILIPGIGNWFCIASDLGGLAMGQLLHLLEGAFRTFQALLRSLTHGLQSLCTGALHFRLPDCGGVTSKGVEGGKPIKKMASVQSEDGLKMTTWDLSDDSTHAEANTYHGRAIIHDDLRSDFMTSGIYNVTLIHTVLANVLIPILAYQTGEDQFNYHWRPDVQAESTAEKKPHFHNNGAGFKMSSVMSQPTQSDATYSKKQIKVIADTIVNDLLHKRQKATNVGYQQDVAEGKPPGHRLCFIAEKGRFRLNNEASKCFPK